MIKWTVIHAGMIEVFDNRYIVLHNGVTREFCVNTYNSQDDGAYTPFIISEHEVAISEFHPSLKRLMINYLDRLDANFGAPRAAYLF